MSWISTKEKTPKKDKYVLLCGIHRDIHKGMLTITGYEGDDREVYMLEIGEDLEKHEVIYWMEIPELPK
jgi:hypothetical protein